jgi:hypothetical protein
MTTRSAEPEDEPAHDTPVVGPREQPTKVEPIDPERKDDGSYETGVPTPRPKHPWIDEGEVEHNG